MRIHRFMPVLALLIASGIARADTYLFTYTGVPTVNTFSFSAPSSPIPDDFGSTFFHLANVDVTVNGVHETELIEFDTSGGFISFRKNGDQTFNDSYFGLPQSFSGSVSAPTFLTGSYTLEDAADDHSVDVGSGTLVITDTDIVATPEPSSFVLLGTGVLGLVSAGRRRRLF